jgi:hypothetical protein
MTRILMFDLGETLVHRLNMIDRFGPAGSYYRSPDESIRVSAQPFATHTSGAAPQSQRSFQRVSRQVAALIEAPGRENKRDFARFNY